MTSYIATIGLFRTVFQINNDFSRKSQNSPPSVFDAPDQVVSLGIGHRRLGYRNDGATGLRKKLDDIFSLLDTIHDRDGQTGAQTPGDSKDRAYTHSVARDVVTRFT